MVQKRLESTFNAIGVENNREYIVQVWREYQTVDSLNSSEPSMVPKGLPYAVTTCGKSVTVLGGKVLVIDGCDTITLSVPEDPAALNPDEEFDDE